MYTSGRLDQAKAAALDWAREQPKDLHTRIALTQALLLGHESSSALSVASTLPNDERVPDHLRAIVMHDRVDGHMRNQDFDSAREEAEAMTQLFPRLGEAWMTVGSVAFTTGDLTLAHASFSRARGLIPDAEAKAQAEAEVDRVITRTEVRQAFVAGSLLEVLHLCDVADERGFELDGWFGRRRALVLWYLGRHHEATAALDKARDLAIATEPHEWGTSGYEWERGDASVRAVIRVDLDDDPTIAERLALQARGEGTHEADLFPLAYVRAKANLPGAADAIRAYVTVSTDEDSSNLLLSVPNGDGRPWRDVLELS